MTESDIWLVGERSDFLATSDEKGGGVLGVAGGSQAVLSSHTRFFPPANLSLRHGGDGRRGGVRGVKSFRAEPARRHRRLHGVDSRAATGRHPIEAVAAGAGAGQGKI